jgi:hypothetical protein
MAAVERGLALIAGAVVMVAGAATGALAAGVGGHSHPAGQPLSTAASPMATPHREAPTTVTAPKPRARTSPTRPVPPPTVAVSGPVTLAGCPVPPHPPLPPPPPPWHPAVLVPDSALPPITKVPRWRSDLAPITGTGMWIWEWGQTDGGDAAAVVRTALAAHIHQLWVRVGDSMNGFYGARELDELVPAAHAAGIDVVAWGFPYFYDPVGDARWTAQILAWRSPSGQSVDGYSADIERSSEGVYLTAHRVGVYLQAVRRAAAGRLVVATVYPPTDANWYGHQYPYTAMAPYVDAFAPMIYWECTDPGSDASSDVARLSSLRPVHVIGQAFNMADVEGRAIAPSAAEITEFLQAGRRAGAIGGSFWVWQDASPAEWAAIEAYRW